jgi:SAM-dependent methyltransferase
MVMMEETPPALETESVNCALCGSPNRVVLSRETEMLALPEPLRVAECRACGFVYTSPRLTRAAYDRYCARQEYFEAYDYDAMIDRVRKAAFQSRLERIGRTIKIGRMLDIGCATGEFLSAATQLGWQPFGVEPSAYAAKEAWRRHGLPVENTSSLAGFADGFFDVAHMSHVLEHVPDPLDTLREVNRVLRPGGVVVVEVPYELGSWLFNFDVVRGRKSTFPSIHHLSFFSPATLKRLLAQCGFEAQVASVSPKRREGRTWWTKLALTALAYVGDTLAMGENIEGYAVKRTPRKLHSMS